MSYVFDPSNYGLTKTDKKGHPDDGIVSDGKGNYYKIDNFERQQRDDLDTDQGDVFGSDLEKHARKYTDFDVSSFNTGSDVEGAVQMLAGLGDDEPDLAEKIVQGQSFNEAFESGNMDPQAMAAIQFANDYTKDIMSDINALDAKKKFAKDNNLGMYGTSKNVANIGKAGTMSEDARLNDDGEWELIDDVTFTTDAEKLNLMGAIGNKALDHVIAKG